MRVAYIYKTKKNVRATNATRKQKSTPFGVLFLAERVVRKLNVASPTPIDLKLGGV
jgi:hypothetical protein